MRSTIEMLLFAAAPVVGAALYGLLFLFIRLLWARLFGAAPESSAGTGTCYTSGRRPRQ